MSSAAARLVLACVLMIAAAGVARAQSSQANANAQDKTKKHANQVPDSGLDEPQAAQALAPFERVIEAVPVKVRPDGTVGGRARRLVHGSRDGHGRTRRDADLRALCGPRQSRTCDAPPAVARAAAVLPSRSAFLRKRSSRHVNAIRIHGGADRRAGTGIRRQRTRRGDHLILNGNAAGVGFNDPTPRAPIGGNTGTTLGQQRLIAFQRAADLWGATIDSPVPILILATFEAQICTATSATLGSAGTRFIYTNFPHTGLYPGPVQQDVWHGGALADKRAGFEIDPLEDDGVTPRADIRARFNSLLNGNPACLGGRQWYLGLDRNHGTDIDLITVLLHEFSHGLGFQQFASVTEWRADPDETGTPRSDVFNLHIFDNAQGKYWPQMTRRRARRLGETPGAVVFDGPTVNAAVPSVLPGAPALFITAPAAIAGTKAVGTASFGAKLGVPGVAGGVVVGLDDANDDGTDHE